MKQAGWHIRRIFRSNPLGGFQRWVALVIVWGVGVVLSVILTDVIPTGATLAGAGRAETARSGPSRPKEMICEDGDVYIIAEEAEIPAAKLPDVKDDWIVVDTKALRLTYFRNGQKEAVFPVAIGEAKTPTPIGEWRIVHKGGNWGSGFGVRWIGINVPWGIYGIHGTDKPWSIGSNSSHGCVRMYNRDVLKLYRLVKLGTPVRILGETPRVRLRREYSRKQSGRDVLVLQFALRRAGFDVGEADGRFGPAMEAAVIRLQRYYGLTPTGKITPTEQYVLGLSGGGGG